MEGKVPPRRRRRRKGRAKRKLAAALPALIALGALSCAWGATETWIGQGSTAWSLGANWLDGTAPGSSGDSAFAVQFRPPSGVTSLLDLGVFSLSRLDFATEGTASIDAAAGNALRFAGAAPEIAATAPGSATFNTPIILAGTTPELRIAGAGSRIFQFNGAISEGGGAQKLVIDTVRLAAGLGSVVLATANSFSGGVDLRGGTLQITQATALGTGSLRVFGGFFTPSAATLANDASLSSSLVLADPGNVTWSGVISSAVADTGLSLRGVNTVTLTAASTYSGATTLDFSPSPSLARSRTGTLLLSGAGSILQSGVLNVNAGTTLTIGATQTGVTNRLGDTATLNLRSGTMRFADTGTRSETLGQVTLAGHSTITPSANSGTILRLDVAGFSRPERGTLALIGIGTPTGLGTGQVFSTAAPALVGGGGAAGTPNISIVPYAVGGTATAASFLTYTAAGGFRTLNTSTEYATTLTAGADRNARISSTTLSSTATVNSLWLPQFGQVNGAGTLTVASGAIAAADFTSIQANLDFGNAEGIIITPTTGGILTVSGSISGTNGLTKGGIGYLRLQSANPFTGPLTINSGTVMFTAQNQLGADSGAIVLNDSAAMLLYEGAGNGTLSRPLALNTGVPNLAINNPAANLTFSGDTSGVGGLRLLGGIGGKLTMAGNATHTGPTIVGGRIGFASDAALGAGDLAFDSTVSPILELAGAWTTGRRIDFNVDVILLTNGFNVVLGGPLTGAATLRKSTAGNVRITSPSAYAPAITMDTGRLEIAGTGVFGGALTLTNGAALVLDNAAAAQNNRVSGGTLQMLNGEVRLEGNANTPVFSQLGALSLSNLNGGGNYVISVTSPGAAGNTLQLAGFSPLTETIAFPAARPPVRLQATALGGAAGTPYTRVLLTGAAAGLVPSAVVDDPAGATSFALNDLSTDAAGTIGLRAPKAGEYSTATIVSNPANGGSTPTNAHLLLAGAGAASGAQNTAQTLTLAAGSTLNLTAGQQLALTSGGIIARPGATPAQIAGGTLDLSGGAFGFYLAGDLQLASNVAASSVSKFGPGTLILQSGAHLPATVIVGAGAITAAAAAPLHDSLVSLGTLSTLQLTAAADIGGLAGVGVVQTNGQTATLGTLPADFTFAGTITGPGALRISGGGNPEANRTLSAANTFTGGVTLDSGVLTFTNTAAIGTGTLTANGGALNAPVVLANPLVLNGTLGVRSGITLGPAAPVSGTGGLVLGSATAVSFQGPADFGGSLSALPYFPIDTGTNLAGIKVEGAAGTLRAGAGLQLGANTNLTLPETTLYTGPGPGRLGDDTAIELRGAAFSIGSSTSPAINFSERFGALRLAGFNTLRLTPNASGSIDLAASSLDRLNRGTMEILPARSLGATAAASAFLRFDTPPATTDGGVVPYVTAKLNGFSDTYGVVVYEAANGLRLLDSAEYTTTLAAATPATHLKVSSSLVNSAAITVRSLTLGTSSNTLTGGGSVSLASGLLVAPSVTSVDNTINFGAQEAFLSLQTASFTGTTFLRPVTGSGGLTLFGSGTVEFPGGNVIAGDLVLNGSARIRLSDPAQLGPASTEILVSGRSNGAGFISTGNVTIARPIRIADGDLYAGAPAAGSTLSFTGGLSGPGGLYVATGNSGTLSGLGYIILAGTNTYTGPTLLEGQLAFASDAALGATSKLVYSTGGIKLLGNWNTTRRLEPSGDYGALNLDTNGYNADFQGLLPTGSFVVPQIRKTGAGALIFSTPQAAFGGSITALGGDVILRDTANFRFGQFTVTTGARLVIDNTAQAAVRQVNTVLAGGELKVLGNAAQSTVQTGSLNGSIYLFGDPPAYSTATLAPTGAGSITLELTGLQTSNGGFLLLRGDGLGTAAAGAYARIRVAPTPTLANGVLPGIVIDSSSTGLGENFATYDSSSDSAGVIGVRALKPVEQISTPQLANPANGGLTPATANFRATGQVAVSGASNTVNTLMFEPGARLNLGAGQTLAITQNMLLVRPGADAEIAGGVIASSSSTPVTTFGGGNMLFGATIPVDAALRHFGPGVLTVTQPQNKGTFNASGGIMRVAAGNPLAQTILNVEQNGRFELAGVSTDVQQLSGTGTVDLTGGTLKVTSASAFAGNLTGSGNLVSTGSNPGLTLSGSYALTGSLGVDGGVLTLTGTALDASGISIQRGTFNVSHTLGSTARLGAAPVSMSGGTLTVNPATAGNTDTVLGTLAGAGMNFINLNNSSSTTAPIPQARLAFAGLSRQERGGFFFTLQSSQPTGRFDFTTDISSQLIGDSAVALARPVLPYGVINGQPATFEPGVGLRPLSASEHTSALVAGANLRVSSTPALNTDLTINSLEMAGSLIGTGTLHVTSGLVTGGGGYVNPKIDFGSVEGNFFNYNGSQAQFYGAISGTNGLTITTAANYNVALYGANTFTGPVTVNGGTVYINSDASLGAGSASIVLRGGIVSTYLSGAAITISKPVELLEGANRFTGESGSSAAITLAGPISGAGVLSLGGDITLSNPGNSYTSPTTFFGTLRLPGDAVLGQSPSLVLTSGFTNPVLILTGDLLTSRAVAVNGAGTFNTGGFDANLTGPVTGASQLTKTGAGALTIHDALGFTGPMLVSIGTVRLESDLGGTGAITVSASGRLEGDATFARPLAVSGTLAPGLGLGFFETGNLTFNANSKLELQLATPVAFDQLRVDGSVTFGGATQLSLDLTGATLGDNFSIPIVLNDGTDAISRSATKGFAIGSQVLVEGDSFLVGNQPFRITYAGGDGNDIYLSVPEPSAAALLLLGAAPLLRRRRSG